MKHLLTTARGFSGTACNNNSFYHANKHNALTKLMKLHMKTPPFVCKGNNYWRLQEFPWPICISMCCFPDKDWTMCLSVAIEWGPTLQQAGTQCCTFCCLYNHITDETWDEMGKKTQTEYFKSLETCTLLKPVFCVALNIKSETCELTIQYNDREMCCNWAQNLGMMR